MIFFFSETSVTIINCNGCLVWGILSQKLWKQEVVGGSTEVWTAIANPVTGSAQAMVVPFPKTFDEPVVPMWDDFGDNPIMLVLCDSLCQIISLVPIRAHMEL